MKPETEIDETGSFGEPEEKPAPFWKRSGERHRKQACLRLMMRMLAYRPGKPHKNHHLPFSPLRL